jgi:MFS family permease
MPARAIQSGPLQGLTRDGWVLFLTRFVRLFSYGALSVVLVFYLTGLGLGESQTGTLLTLTLLGDTVVSLCLTTQADRIGRRRMLTIGALLMTGAGITFACTGNFLLLIIAGTIGVISPSGNEVGPFLPIEQAALSQIVPSRSRTQVFAWYSLAGSVATAVGSLAAGFVVQGLRGAALTPVASERAVVLLYAAMGLVLALLFRTLSASAEVRVDAQPLAAGEARKILRPPAPRESAVVEVSGEPLAAGQSAAEAQEKHQPSAPRESAAREVSRERAIGVKRLLGLGSSRAIVLRLSGLFALDAFGGGFVVQSFAAYWFYLRYGVEPATLGGIFFGANVFAGISALLASRLASRIGLVKTMVFTHLPSNVLLILVPLMPSLSLAILVLLLRFSISQMDVPTRQSYAMAIVEPDERSATAGITGVARTTGAAIAPLFAGMLFAQPSLIDAPFFIAGTLKIAYDLLLYRAFVRLEPSEEGS